MAKNKKNSALISALLYIVLGILLLVFRGGMIDILMKIAGLVFIVFGVIELLKKNWVGGAISVIIGILILVFGGFLKDIAFLVLGILLAVKGVISLIGALTAKQKNLFSLLFPILTIVCGCLLAFASGKVVDVITIIVGIFLLIDGILGIASEIKK